MKRLIGVSSEEFRRVNQKKKGDDQNIAEDISAKVEQALDGLDLRSFFHFDKAKGELIIRTAAIEKEIAQKANVYIRALGAGGGEFAWTVGPK